MCSHCFPAMERSLFSGTATEFVHSTATLTGSCALHGAHVHIGVPTARCHSVVTVSHHGLDPTQPPWKALESPGKPWNLESFTRTQPVGLGFCIDPAPCIGFHVRRLLMLAGPVRLWKLQSLSPFLLIHGDGGCNIGSSALLNDLMDLNGM